jgi:hypothetical protein
MWMQSSLKGTSENDYLPTHSLTHSMVQDTIWKADCHLACEEYHASFMETEGSVPC